MKVATIETGEFGITGVVVVNQNKWTTDLYAPGGMNYHTAFFFMLQHDVSYVMDLEMGGDPMTIQEWYWNCDGGLS